MKLNNSSLSPIVIFVYNRPWHTAQTLSALEKNELAKDSEVFIYADGSKTNISSEQNQRIQEVRKVIRQDRKFKKVHIVERTSNHGLAQSIILGVSEIINKYGKVIVLEDDLITSSGFLKYMNDALNIYEYIPQVMHVSGYWFPVINSHKLPKTFFYNTASCWGWGTWKSAWAHLDTDARKLAENILKKDGDYYHFDIEGSGSFSRQLKQNISGHISTWAVKWYASMYLKNGYSLHPNHSLVNNIGNDGSGQNSGKSNAFSWTSLAERVEVREIPIVESQMSRRMIAKFYGKSKKAKLISKIKTKFPSSIKSIYWHYKSIKNEAYKEIRKLERFTPFEIDLEGITISVPDNASFLFMYKEIFEQKIYNFNCTAEQPIIIDGGANIGLSTIYFKRRFPHAKVLAFEPDPYIFEFLTRNIIAFKLTDVELHNVGLWNQKKSISFEPDGADGGRINESSAKKSIDVISLRPFLEKNHVDFLKLDIEGAELVVLENIQDLLSNVHNIFIEYHSFTNSQQKLSVILEILQKAGYRYFISSPGLKSPQPLVHINRYNGMDMQLNIYARRI